MTMAKPQIDRPAGQGQDLRIRMVSGTRGKAVRVGGWLLIAGLVLLPAGAVASHPDAVPELESASGVEVSPDARDRTQALSRFTPEKRKRMIRRLNRYRRLSPEKKDRVRRGYLRFQQYSPEERRRLHQRFDQWENLAPEKQRRLLKRYQRFNSLSPEARERMIQRYRKWKSLPQDQRERQRPHSRSRR